MICWFYFQYNSQNLHSSAGCKTAFSLCIVNTTKTQPEASSAFLQLCLIMVIILANVKSFLESALAQLNLISLHKSFCTVVLDSFLRRPVNFQGFVPSHVISNPNSMLRYREALLSLKDIWTTERHPNFSGYSFAWSKLQSVVMWHCFLL